ncbi:MAG: hypothetical protein RXO36_05005 [Candidatus Nanopusillus acidilobi]
MIKIPISLENAQIILELSLKSQEDEEKIAEMMQGVSVKISAKVKNNEKYEDALMLFVPLSDIDRAGLEADNLSVRTSIKDGLVLIRIREGKK